MAALGGASEAPTVFLTGATGSIGSAALRAMSSAGMKVTAMSRSEKKTDDLKAAGAAEVCVGSLTTDAKGLQELAKGYDAIVHTALSNGPDGEAIERATIAALIAAAQETSKAGKACHLVCTSTLWTVGAVSGDDEIVDEESASTKTPGCPDFAKWRVEVEEEQVVAASDGKGVTTAVVRPSWVYGGPSDYVAMAIDAWKAKGKVVVPSGNKWFNMVHADDLGALYAAIVQKRAEGIFHGCDGVPVRVSDAIEAGKKHLGLDESEEMEDVMAACGMIGPWAIGMGINQRADSKRSKALGWKPKWESWPTYMAAQYASSSEKEK